MNNEKMGQFIAELRKAKKLTQKELAAKLLITDKAVSKWERGLSCPDISLLSSVAEILGVSVNELLNGEKNSSDTVNIEASINNALTYADKTAKKKVKSLQNIGAFSYSILLLIGLIVCAICDLAMTGSFTWSLYPNSSIIVAWLIFFPVIKFGIKGLYAGMAALTVLIIPYLYVLDSLIGGNSLLLPIGIRMSVISVVFLWCMFGIFKLLRSRKLIAAAISVLLMIPLQIIINFILSDMISEPLMDVWDMLSYSVILLIAAALFALDYSIRRKRILAENQ